MLPNRSRVRSAASTGDRVLDLHEVIQQYALLRQEPGNEAKPRALGWVFAEKLQDCLFSILHGPTWLLDEAGVR